MEAVDKQPGPQWLADKVAEFGGPYAPRDFRIVTDTTEFFEVEPYDVVALGGRYYLVRGHEFERRFSLDEVPKYWVKRAVDLGSGQKKILKLVFYESFGTQLGPVQVRYVRSPRKEARILDLVRGHPSFMQGLWLHDERGNNIRILDRIRGRSLDAYIEDISLPHEAYFFKEAPKIMANLVTCFEAIGFLHEQGEKHGDIRRDHILIEWDTGAYRWIDFDLDYFHPEHPFGVDLFGLGNVLLFVVGKEIHTLSEVKAARPEVFARLIEEDCSPVLGNRIMNLKKLFPYIPDKLNNILLHFSVGSSVFYEGVEELVADLGDYLAG